MIRLLIYCEGQTEQEFVKTILTPHFADRGIILASPPSMNGTMPYGRFQKAIKNFLASHDVVTTLIDYYGPHRYHKSPSASSVEGVCYLEQKLAEDIGDRGFIPYYQLHEFEALLFSDCRHIARLLGNIAKDSELQHIVKSCSEPEYINGNYDTVPSRRLKRIFTHYNKVLHGISIAQAIGLEKMRTECPRFNQWITQLEALN